MFCTNCGQKRAGNEPYCKFCGKAFATQQNQSNTTFNSVPDNTDNAQNSADKNVKSDTTADSFQQNSAQNGQIPPFVGVNSQQQNQANSQNSWQNNVPPNTSQNQTFPPRYGYQQYTANEQPRMRVCKNCATELPESDSRTSCPFCGAHLPHNTPVSNSYGAFNPINASGAGWNPSANEPASGNLNVLNMVLSIINIAGVFCCQLISVVLGIVALVYTLSAPKKPTKVEENNANKTALILNIIAICLNSLNLLGLVLFFI